MELYFINSYSSNSIFFEHLTECTGIKKNIISKFILDLN